MIRDRDQRRERAWSFALTVVLHLIFLALILLWKNTPIPVRMEARLKGFMLMPEAKDKGEAKKADAKAETRKTQAAAQTTDTTKPPPPPIPPPEVTAPTHNKLPFIEMNSQDFAAANIGKIASARPAASAGSGESGANSGPGEGRDGTSLYAADWFRRPTSTELSTYIPARAPPSGWGLIACKTVARYHVEDCYMLDESPRGSGFGRAVLNAAWQFLVLPPRLNGRTMVGTWVSIRITYTEKAGFQPSD